MKVYHASPIVVNSPDTKHSRDFLDFGKGFYFTTLYNQALKYGQRFIRNQGEAYINVYELSYHTDDWNILTFKQYNEEWLYFVMKCRSGQTTDSYDMVVGGIANDKVIETLTLFFSQIISKEEALGRLKFEKPNIQYCIRSERMIHECLTFTESIKL